MAVLNLVVILLVDASVAVARVTKRRVQTWAAAVRKSAPRILARLRAILAKLDKLASQWPASSSAKPRPVVVRQPAATKPRRAVRNRPVAPRRKPIAPRR